MKAITDNRKVYNEYAEEKINNIVELGDFSGTQTEQLRSSNLEEETFYIEHSRDISAEYDRYEGKYTLKLDGEIAALLYYLDEDEEDDEEADKVNYIERYDRPTYDNDKNYFQVVHNENEDYTIIFDRQTADSEVPVSVLVTIKENSDTKEYTMTQIRTNQDLDSDYPDVGRLVVVEDLSSDKFSAVFNHKAANFDESSNFYADKDAIYDIIDNWDLDPIRGGQIDDLDSGDYDFEPLEDFTADDGYPAKDDVKELYNDGSGSEDFANIHKLDFDLDNFEYQSDQTLIELLGLN